MKTNIHLVAVLSFLMPVISSLFAIYMPDVESIFNYFIGSAFVVGIVMYIIMLASFKKKKRQNAARLIIAFNMMVFCMFFIFPFVKAFMGHLWLQVLLTLFFFCLLALAIHDQKQEIPLVFPGSDKEHRKFALVFYAIPVVLVVLGGGGNIIFVRELSNFLGDGFVTYWGGGLLYGFGCWLAFFMQSLFYQGFVKNGVLVK